jgi:hypothetical protein
MRILFMIAAATVVFLSTSSVPVAQVRHQNSVIDLWTEGKPAFGVFVPDGSAPQASPGGLSRTPPPSRLVYTREGAENIGANPLYDFVFLNLESAYDRDAINVTVAGLRGAKTNGRKTLIVRIPPIDVDGVLGRTASPFRTSETLHRPGRRSVFLPTRKPTSGRLRTQRVRPSRY